MADVIVFDTGRGGEIYANFLEQELGVVNVKLVLDAPYDNKNKITIRRLVDEALREYIGKVDVIFIANNLVVNVALEYLKRKYPSQKIIGVKWPTLKRYAGSGKKLLVITTKRTKWSKNFIRMRTKKWKGMNVEVYECDEWLNLLNNTNYDNETVKDELEKIKQMSPDIIVLDSSLMGEIEWLEQFFSWRSWVVDNRTEVLKNVSSALDFAAGMHVR